MTFAEFLLERHAVTPQDLLRCLDYRRWLMPFLGTLAVNRGLLDTSQVLRIVEMTESKRRQFGEIAIELGFLDDSQVDVLLDEQESVREPLPQCLMKLGILTRTQVDELREKYLQSSSKEESASSRVND